MPESSLHEIAVWTELGLAALTFISLFFITAPYGRHLRDGWGPTMPSRLGWVLMEAPAVLLFLAIFFQGEHAAQTVPLVLLAIWQFHYIHRTFIFPFRMRIKGKRVPVSVPVLAIVFNTLNAYINARWISHFGSYEASWLSDPRFVAGVSLFALGFLINFHSDSILFRLRKPGETGYKIPEGGFYRFVSCPNYFGEILEWAGWALLTWSGAGLAFFLYTAANLAPRAFSNHRWYHEKFPDYPAERKALLPFVA